MPAEIEVPPHVAETVQAIALLHAEHHKASTAAERAIDRATNFIGRPKFLLALLILSLLWTAGNAGMALMGIKPLDPPPFAWLELTLTSFAILISVMILASQLRADRFANLRERMTLEATLLTEQKSRKIIELLEELRRDLPDVRNRLDTEAEQMTMRANPHEVLAVIENVTQEAEREP